MSDVSDVSVSDMSDTSDTSDMSDVSDMSDRPTHLESEIQCTVHHTVRLHHENLGQMGVR